MARPSSSRCEYDQVLLGLHGWDNYHLGTTDPWETVADLQGVKIGGAGPNLPWLEFAGAVPVQSTLPDGYLSMQTGVYNGWLMFPSAYLGFKFYEPCAVLYPHRFWRDAGQRADDERAHDGLACPRTCRQIFREVGAAYEAQAGESLNAAQAGGLAGLRRGRRDCDRTCAGGAG